MSRRRSISACASVRLARSVASVRTIRCSVSTLSGRSAGSISMSCKFAPTGETVSEMLDHVPARLRVIRICRPRYGCRACGTIHQAPAPERPIAKGLASPGLLAHVLVAKYCDHLPLYRQSQIFARHGVESDRSTLANWVG